MRKLILILLALCLLAAGGYLGRRAYRAWKWRHAVTQARELMTKGDFKEGTLWLRKALQGNPGSVEAVRMMGDFTELIRSPNTVFWRERLVQLEPKSITNRLMLARAAIVASQFDVAKKALDGVDDQGKKTADYLKVMGAFATTTGQYLEAETNFAQACLLEPQNPIPQLNLAVIRVQRKDPQLAGEARQSLENLRTNPVVRTDALRHLTLDAMRHTNYDRAIPIVRELVSHTNSLFNDRLLELDVLRAAKSPEFQPTITALQREVATNAPSVFGVARWMLAGTTPTETLTWLQTVQPQIRTNLPVTMVVADCYLATSNWNTLDAWVGRQQWGELDYLRLAFSARAQREQNLSTSAKAAWSKTMKAAEGRLDRLVALQRLAAAWNWPAELEEVLWLVVTKFPAEKGAVQSLSNLLFLTGKTRSLLTLMAQENKADPANVAVKNNLAAVALLLNAPEHKPHELAREVYEKEPGNPSYASTYAYSLYLLKKNPEALQVMEKMKPESLEQPNIAGYYGVMLAASGDKAKAKKYLDLAAKARVLPEEKQMFERADF